MASRKEGTAAVKGEIREEVGPKGGAASVRLVAWWLGEGSVASRAVSAVGPQLERC